jgi:hypothetical protein
MGTQQTLRAGTEQSAQAQQAVHDLLISNQVSKGFELLGSGNLETRLGGICALEGVMNGSETCHQPVLDALCAFIAAHTICIIVGDHPASDTQATLTVIGRTQRTRGNVNLSSVRIQGADLGRAKLPGAVLFFADLTHTILVEADLTGAYLNGAVMSRARLSAAILNGAYLTGADLTRADLSEAHLRGADLLPFRQNWPVSMRDVA